MGDAERRSMRTDGKSMVRDAGNASPVRRAGPDRAKGPAVPPLAGDPWPKAPQPGAAAPSNDGRLKTHVFYGVL